jgi:hypothetical protein
VVEPIDPALFERRICGRRWLVMTLLRCIGHCGN